MGGITMLIDREKLTAYWKLCLKNGMTEYEIKHWLLENAKSLMKQAITEISK